MAVRLHRCGNEWAKYPAIQFEDGTWHREESKDMAAAIRAGRLNELNGKTPAGSPA